MKKIAWNLCKEFLAGPWGNVSLEEFGFSEIRGGLSNMLYRCSLPENVVVENSKTPREVLLRIYGLLQEDANDAMSDIVAFLILSERKLGPKLYGMFPNGRLEEYIPSHSLSSDELRKYSTTIAREMAKIHALDVPLRKIPDFWDITIKKWLEEVKEVIAEDAGKYFMSITEYEKEIEWLSAEIKKTNSPIVFCHNDLQGGNVLCREDSTKNGSPDIMLIDFEFGRYNYRGFDIANHLCEWCCDYNTPEFPHFEVDLKKFPSKGELMEFCLSYLGQLSKENVHIKKSMREEAEEIMRDINIFACACHLIWSLWSIKMVRTETRSFGHTSDQINHLENEDETPSSDDRHWKERLKPTIMAAIKEHAKTRREMFYVFKERALSSTST